MKLFSDALMAERKIKDIEKENNVWDAIEYLTQHPQTKFKQRLIDVVLKAPNSAEIIRQNKPVFGFLYDDSILKLTSDVGYVLNYLEQAKPVKDKRPFIDFILSQDATPSVLMDFGIVLGDENGIMPQEIQEALIAKTIVVSNAWELHLENFSEENRQKMALNIMNRAETEKVGNSANILKSLNG